MTTRTSWQGKKGNVGEGAERSAEVRSSGNANEEMEDVHPQRREEENIQQRWGTASNGGLCISDLC